MPLLTTRNLPVLVLLDHEVRKPWFLCDFRKLVSHHAFHSRLDDYFSKLQFALADSWVVEPNIKERRFGYWFQHVHLDPVSLQNLSTKTDFDRLDHLFDNGFWSIIKRGKTTR